MQESQKQYSLIKGAALTYLQQNAYVYSIQKGTQLFKSGAVKKVFSNEEMTDLSFVIQGSSQRLYTVKLEDVQKEIKSSCNCEFSYDGICKHTVAALFYLNKNADSISQNATVVEEAMLVPERMSNEEFEVQNPFDFQFLKENYNVKSEYLSPVSIVDFNDKKIEIQIEEKTQRTWWNQRYTHNVKLIPKEQNFLVSCSCKTEVFDLCIHAKSALSSLHHDAYIKDFYEAFKNPELLLNKAVEEYGILDIKQYKLSRKDNAPILIPKYKNVVKPADFARLNLKFETNLINNPLKNELLIEDNLNSDDSYRKTIYAYCISFTDDIHYPFLIRPITAKGKPEENKIVSHIKPVDFYHNEKIGVASSYFSPSSFWNIDKRADDNEVNPEKLKTGLRLLKKIFPQLKNELVFQVPEIDRIRKMDLEEVFFFPEHNPLLSFTFTENDNYYILKTFLSIEGKKIPIKEFKTFGVVVMLKDSDLYLLSSPQDAMVVQYFRKNHELLFPKTSFEDVFKTAVYPLINDYNVSINVKKNIEEYKHKKVLTSIYLSELNDFVLFTPMMEYDDIQVKLFNETNVVMNASGQVVKLNRDLDLESDFQEFFLKLNPKFEARMNRDLFYLTVNELMQNQWFFEFFNKAKDKGVEVFGFDKLKNFKYSPHKAKVVVNVSSGIDWFDTTIEISFGEQKIKLQDVKKALINKERYVKLGDGTIGMLPDEWIERLENYFRLGNVEKDKVKISKLHFNVLDDEFLNHLDAKTLLEIQRKKTKLLEFDSIKEVKLPKNLKAELRPYQLAGYHWLHFLNEFNFGGCLADDMGLGKTVQVLTFLLSLKNKDKLTHLVVVPRSLLFNWQDEVLKFTPSLKVLVQHGNSRVSDINEFQKYDIILTTYGTLVSDEEMISKFKFDYAILDESQAIKNPLSKRFKAVCTIQSENKLVLTGTPIENNTFDLFSQMHFANPGLLGSKNHFKETYSDAIDKNKDEKMSLELSKIIHPFILRRTKKQVATDLPEKTESILYCEMGEEQRNVYSAFRNKYRDILLGKFEEEGFEKSKMYVLEGLTKLRQICDSPAILPDEENYGSASAKLDELMKHIQEKTGNHKILIFSQFVKMLKLIEAKMVSEKISYTYLDGKSTDRKKLVNQFQEDDNTRVFLISLKAGGTGLNLTAADYVYIVDPWWNPAVEAQAIDRCYRIGQEKHVFAYKMICKDTVEEKIIQLQQSKKSLSEDIIKTDDAFFKTLKKDEIIELFS